MLRYALLSLLLLACDGGELDASEFYEEPAPGAQAEGEAPAPPGGAPAPGEAPAPTPMGEAPEGEPEAPPERVDPEAPEEVDTPDEVPPEVELDDPQDAPDAPEEPEAPEQPREAPEPDDPCQGLDYLGECQGRTARWCNNEGELETRDCGNRSCGWVDGETGYFCGGNGDRPGGDPEPEPQPDPDPDPQPEPQPDPPSDEGECGTPEEAEVARLANEARAQNGRGALDCDMAGVRAARAHSEDMCNQGYFSHTGRDGSSAGDRMRRAGAQFGGWGENIAWGQRTSANVHNTWMNSSGHRRNILSGGFGRIGVGYYACNGRPHWTQVFMD